ncbi:hypothetical protein PROFUN_10319 [Planoprotostelium fungivorum]|uniref:Uncharacterized protein n=1 Tax=Planoprotostelium fungivorum TaxID=1890364 RepID=A0A2P6NDV2_9EUKA|nr:hypothetical protein PROFUN_10319 [Planoprotostelium fungivorum]
MKRYILTHKKRLIELKGSQTEESNSGHHHFVSEGAGYTNNSGVLFPDAVGHTFIAPPTDNAFHTNNNADPSVHLHLALNHLSGVEWTSHLNEIDWMRRSSEGRIVFDLHAIVPRLHIQGLSANRFFHSKERLKPGEWSHFTKFDKFMICPSCKIGSVYSLWREKVFAFMMMNAGGNEYSSHPSLVFMDDKAMEERRGGELEENVDMRREVLNDMSMKKVNVSQLVRVYSDKTQIETEGDHLMNHNGVMNNQHDLHSTVDSQSEEEEDDEEEDEEEENMSHGMLPNNLEDKGHEREDDVTDTLMMGKIIREDDGTHGGEKGTKKSESVEVKRNTAVKRSNAMMDKMRALCSEQQEVMEDVMDIYMRKNVPFLFQRLNRFAQTASRKKLQRVTNFLQELLEKKPTPAGDAPQKGPEVQEIREVSDTLQTPSDPSPPIL